MACKHLAKCRFFASDKWEHTKLYVIHAKPLPKWLQNIYQYNKTGKFHHWNEGWWKGYSGVWVHTAMPSAFPEHVKEITPQEAQAIFESLNLKIKAEPPAVGPQPQVETPSLEDMLAVFKKLYVKDVGL